MEPQPNQFALPALTDEERDAANKYRESIIARITSQVTREGYEEHATFKPHRNVLYPHQVSALSPEQKASIATTIVAWRDAPENRGFLNSLNLETVLGYIENNEVFVYITDDHKLMACARLHPDPAHQVDGKGRVIFGMAMKVPQSQPNADHPDAREAFKHVADARLVLCANAYVDLRPRAFISRNNGRNLNFHLVKLGLDVIRTLDSTGPVVVKLNELVEALDDVAIPDEIKMMYQPQPISSTGIERVE